MAQSVRNIVTDINNTLAGIFRGGIFYGVATLVEREGKSQPVVDEKSVTFDNSYPMQMYHKIVGVNITYTPGYGDNDNTTNTFAMSAVVFNDEKQTRLKQDELAMIMQSALSKLNITPAVTLTSIILNSQQVWATEYRGTVYGLNEYQSLMQINYSIAVTFQSGCFDLCPEDFLNCKTN